METNMKSSINIDMGIMFKHRVDATKPSNIPTTMENFLML
jgi:hypothetical protein